MIDYAKMEETIFELIDASPDVKEKALNKIISESHTLDDVLYPINFFYQNDYEKVTKSNKKYKNNVTKCNS